MKVELRKEVRIKKDENSTVLERVRDEIRERIEKEYNLEMRSLLGESESLRQEEREFIINANIFLCTLNPWDQLIVKTQVGKGSEVIHEYTGQMEWQYKDGDKYFNFRDPSYNEGKYFTIGLSCLLSIEKL